MSAPHYTKSMQHQHFRLKMSLVSALHRIIIKSM